MITVNGKTIDDDAIAREAQYHPAGSLEEALREASVALVVRELLLSEAAALGVAGDFAGERAEDTDERVIEALLDREIRSPVASEEACRSYFESHRDQFRSPDLFEASHILFAARPEDPDARRDALAAATSTVEELVRNPEAFERLAGERSADGSSAKQGGHIGQIVPGQTAPEFEACLRSLEPGELCREAVATRYGYHVVRLDRFSPGREMPYAMARERVADRLGAIAWTDSVRRYLRELGERASIEGIEWPVSDSAGSLLRREESVRSDALHG